MLGLFFAKSKHAFRCFSLLAASATEMLPFTGAASETEAAGAEVATAGTT
jgi:hypothetical protein